MSKDIKKHFLFHLGHPAHFQLFKNNIKTLTHNGNRVSIVIKKKDILESLLQKEELEYINLLPKGRNNSKLGILWGMIKTDFNLLKYCIRNRPDLLIGTSYAISHVGKFLSIPSINVNEDDWNAVPFYAKFSYPWASVILSPSTCNNGKWENKSIKYSGYHELAYLHPNNFTPDQKIAQRYVNFNRPYVIIRFSSFNAHHDKGISGITNETAKKIIEIINTQLTVYITSERELPSYLAKYSLKINPSDIHHVMFYASLYLGDSQTMAAEAGVLGVPFVRFNHFVGRLGYLNELENKYKLGFGFKPEEEKEMLVTLRNLIEQQEELKSQWISKRKSMLSEKINVTSFLNWFIDKYPDSHEIMKLNPKYEERFK
jgi:predicted glycosyltransferase